MAACFCLLVAGGAAITWDGGRTAPDPGLVQVPNPILEVATEEEMKEYLDFDVPVLDKEVESYLVLVEDGYPRMAQVLYADGSEFRMRYGSGDISGIYGGALEKSEETGGVAVHYFRYGDIRYALWEQEGFAFSYVYTGDGSAEVQELIRRMG